MVEMAVRHQHIFDVCKIDADLVEICDQLVDMGFVQSIDQHHSIAGLNRQAHTQHTPTK